MSWLQRWVLVISFAVVALAAADLLHRMGP